METFDTVTKAVNTYRSRVWGHSRVSDCTYRSKADGACSSYTFQVGRIIWKAYFDNYGRAITERAGRI